MIESVARKLTLVVCSGAGGRPRIGFFAMAIIVLLRGVVVNYGYFRSTLGIIVANCCHVNDLPEMAWEIMRGFSVDTVATGG